MKTIEQKGGDDCTVAVLAMILKFSYDKAWCLLMKERPEGPPFSDWDIMKVCLDHRVVIGGYGATIKNGTLPDKNRDVGKIELGYSVELYGNEFYIVCDSGRFTDKQHAMYWDGEKLHDPSILGRENLSQFEGVILMPVYRGEGYASPT